MMFISALVVFAAMAVTGMPTAYLGAVLALLLVYVCVNTHATAPVATPVAAPPPPKVLRPPLLLRMKAGEIDPKDKFSQVDIHDLEERLVKNSDFSKQFAMRSTCDEYKSLCAKLNARSSAAKVLQKHLFTRKDQEE